MKQISLHPASVLAGLALAAVFSVLAGAAQSHGTATSIPIHDVRLVGEIPAVWWTSVKLRGLNNPPELTYVVPPDRYLVVPNGSNGPTLRMASSPTVSSQVQFSSASETERASCINQERC
jgi:hypothetical protein